jgi:hypothetical protein
MVPPLLLKQLAVNHLKGTRKVQDFFLPRRVFAYPSD